MVSLGYLFVASLAVMVSSTAASAVSRNPSLDFAFAESSSLVSPQQAAASQERVIAGTITDAETRGPLVGAQVVIDGTRRGTLSDNAGGFRITGAPAGEVTLRVVMLGYQTQTAKAPPAATNVRIAMRQAAVELDAVVVTGTPGVTKIRGVGNSVSQVTAKKIVETTPISNVQQMLSGRVAGVSIVQGSGNVGSGGATRIRGVSSLTLSNEPLLYVDGVRVDNNPGAGP